MEYTVKTRDGNVTFESNLMKHQAVMIVGAIVADKKDDSQFLTSIYRQFATRGSGSPAQEAWLHYFATGQHEKKRSQGSVSENVKVEDFNGTAILEMFRRARGEAGEIKLQAPQLFVKIGEHEIHLRFCGPNTKNNGGLYIKDTTDGGEGVYMGKITADGSLRPVRKMFDGFVDAMIEFCKDPKEFAIRFGRVTGRCCFCGLELTNRHSIYHGYGPICAEHWGLPHGNAPADWQPSVEARERATEIAEENSQQ